MNYPEELERRRTVSVKRVNADKCPKLELAESEGAHTVLLLENVDIGLANSDLIGNLLAMLREERRVAPNEIYLVQTHANLWWVWTMKRDDVYWPSVGVPEPNQPADEEGKSLTPGTPQWLRMDF